MTRPMFVKVCGLTRREDVTAAVAAGADALGFVFATSPRCVTPKRAAELSRDIPGTVLKVAVMLHPTQAEWAAVTAEFEPDVLQTDACDFLGLRVNEAVTSWPVFRENGTLDTAAFAERPTGDAIYLYEGARSGRGETVDWTVAAERARNGRMILAGGLGPDNVAAAVRAVRPFGVDASSALESTPGEKCAEKITAFVRAAKLAAAESQNEYHDR